MYRSVCSMHAWLVGCVLDPGWIVMLMCTAASPLTSPLPLPAAVCALVIPCRIRFHRLLAQRCCWLEGPCTTVYRVCQSSVVLMRIRWCEDDPGMKRSHYEA